jgi:hypothetical protein
MILTPFELSIVRRVETELEVHELLWGADLELEVLEDRPDVVALEVEQALHPLRVDGAGSHPLLNPGLEISVGAILHRDERLTDTIEQMADQQILVPETR